MSVRKQVAHQVTCGRRDERRRREGKRKYCIYIIM